MNEQLKNFYSNYFFFSYSSITKLLYSPTLFYNLYILKNGEASFEKHLLTGKVIHCLLLEKENFTNNFIVTLNTLPKSNNKKLVEFLYNKERNNVSNNLSDYKVQILEWLVDQNLHQKLLDDEKRLEKILTLDTIEYFKFLKDSLNKTIIDQEILNYAKEAVVIIKEHKKVSELLKLNSDFELIEVYNERKLYIKSYEFPFGLMGIIDNYSIDHINKKVIINDLKTTSKTLSEFKESINYYNYWIQAVIYNLLIKVHHPETKEYDYEFNFIVIDKYNQVYPFNVSKKTLTLWQTQFKEILKIINYHYVNKEYKLPYEFAVNKVSL